MRTILEAALLGTDRSTRTGGTVTGWQRRPTQLSRDAAFCWPLRALMEFNGKQCMAVLGEQGTQVNQQEHPGWAQPLLDPSQAA